MKLLITFEQHTTRVKGLSFHPHRPWILASLHDGTILLYDYRTQVLLHTFKDHDGAVRSVNFHITQPLFVSGGDDYKVKVWNFKLKKCLFTLEGHNDYVRTVEFHKEQPWIVSASDDQTIKIWNWQNRNCLTTITGHHHYVMCASFHPTEDILLSCSLDQELRVWDISSLKHQQFTKPDFLNVSKMNKEIFGYNDVQVKFILQGHERGINWVSFHPTSRYIASGSDDKTVKIWRYMDDSGREVDTLLGHTHNVSSVLFYPQEDVVISNSEDKTIRFWSLSKGQLLDTYSMEEDRFWILSQHPSNNLLAAGHDKGFKIFKIHRERSPYCFIKKKKKKNQLDDVLYISGDNLRKYSFSDGTESSVGSFPTLALHEQFIDISLSLRDKCILVVKRNNKICKDTCEVYRLPNKKKDQGSLLLKLHTGVGSSGVFIGNKKFCYLFHEKIVTRSISNKVSKKIIFSPASTIGVVKKIFKSNIQGRIVLLTVDFKLYVFDIEENSFLCNVQLPKNTKLNSEERDKCKYIIYHGSYMAVFFEYSVVILNSTTLKKLFYIKENIRIKSGLFVNDKGGSDDGSRPKIFLYSTLIHLKYVIVSPDMSSTKSSVINNSSLMKTLKNPIYLVHYLPSSSSLFFFTRKGTISKFSIDSTELRFKLALLNNNRREIKKIMKNSKILGDSMVSYLYKKGFPNLAIKFVKDEKVKFNLAIECNDLKTAKETAYKLDNKYVWMELAKHALKQGKIKIFEKALEKLKNYNGLTFFYFITGQTKKLNHVVDIVDSNEENGGDVMSKFYNSLLVGKVKNRIKILKRSGQLNLALVTAIINNIPEEVVELKKKLGLTEEQFELIKKDVIGSEEIIPLEPLYSIKDDWPLLYDEEENAEHDDDDDDDDDESDDDEREGEDDEEDEEDGGEGGVWGSNELLVKKKVKKKDKEEEGEEGEGGEGGIWDNALNINDDEIKKVLIEQEDSAFVCPSEGSSLLSKVWKSIASYPSDLISVGDFEGGMKLLNQIFGVVNFSPLQKRFMKLFISKQCQLPITNNVLSMDTYLQREESTKKSDVSLPYIGGVSIQNLKDLIKIFEKKTAKEITQGKFKEAELSLTNVLHSLLFINVKRGDKKNYNHLLKLVTEYLIGIKMELYRKTLKKEDVVRNIELSLYFTRCKLKKKHKRLTVFQAMTVNFKAKNFVLANQLADDLLQLDPPKKFETQARYVKKMSTKTLEDALEVDFDKRNHFIICTKEWKPIYTGNDRIKCTFCDAHAKPKYANELCVICGLAKYRKKGIKKKIFDYNFEKRYLETLNIDEDIDEDDDDEEEEEEDNGSNDSDSDNEDGEDDDNENDDDDKSDDDLF